MSSSATCRRRRRPDAFNLAPRGRNNARTGEEVVELVARQEAEQVEEPSHERRGLASGQPRSSEPSGSGEKPVAFARSKPATRHDDQGFPCAVHPERSRTGVNGLDPRTNPNAIGAKRKQVPQRKLGRRQRPPVVRGKALDQRDVVYLTGEGRLAGVVPA
jgi:hypothetical protein